MNEAQARLEEARWWGDVDGHTADGDLGCKYCARLADLERAAAIPLGGPMDAVLALPALERKIRTLEGDLKQINTLYIAALDKLNATSSKW
jgi:hypothetical protein